MDQSVVTMQTYSALFAFRAILLIGLALGLVACSSPLEVLDELGRPELTVGRASDFALVDAEIRVTWSRIDDADSYGIEVRRVDARGTLVDSRLSDGEIATLRFGSPGSYRIRVRALDDEGRASLWSDHFVVRVLAEPPSAIDA
jgi:hypothetical protein